MFTIRAVAAAAGTTPSAIVIATGKASIDLGIEITVRLLGTWGRSIGAFLCVFDPLCLGPTDPSPARAGSSLGRQAECLPRLQPAGKVSVVGKPGRLRHQRCGDGPIAGPAREHDPAALRI